jgi:prevent-host-death family protein
MRSVSAREANQAFSRILSEAEAGQEIVITRRGRPVATLRPWEPPALTPERQAAIEHAIRLMDQGLALGVTRPLTRDEMHER